MNMRAWKVYGADGHRQRESFGETYSFSQRRKEGETAYVVFNSDITHTNEYTIVLIVSNNVSYDQLEDCLWSQISDGIFENSVVGKVEEICLQ